jgi:hypothetical protein
MLRYELNRIWSANRISQLYEGGCVRLRKWLYDERREKCKITARDISSILPLEISIIASYLEKKKVKRRPQQSDRNRIVTAPPATSDQRDRNTAYCTQVSCA